jgi:hypothetical protein
MLALARRMQMDDRVPHALESCPARQRRVRVTRPRSPPENGGAGAQQTVVEPRDT